MHTYTYIIHIHVIHIYYINIEGVLGMFKKRVKGYFFSKNIFNYINLLKIAYLILICMPVHIDTKPFL